MLSSSTIQSPYKRHCSSWTNQPFKVVGGWKVGSAPMTAWCRPSATTFPTSQPCLVFLAVSRLLTSSCCSLACNILLWYMYYSIAASQFLLVGSECWKLEVGREKKQRHNQDNTDKHRGKIKVNSPGWELSAQSGCGGVEREVAACWWHLLLLLPQPDHRWQPRHDTLIFHTDDW